MADNTELPPGIGGDLVRDLARQGGLVKTQVIQLDLGGSSANAEKLITAGQQLMADSVPVVLASNQPALPVSGTFFLATQPVSAAALPLPAGASTEATLAALNTKTPVVGQALAAASSPVVLASNQSAIPVTGTFFQATQPVSVPTLTKSVQTAAGLTTQDLKDAGRNQTNYFTSALVASTAVETLLPLTGYKGGVAVAATATPAVVTAAKVYRVNRIVITYVGLATPGVVQVNLRAAAGAAVLVTSPLVDSWVVGQEQAATAAVAGGAKTITINLPDGIEFPAGTGIGLTAQGLNALGVPSAAGFVKVSLGGYEY
jgi:hypothetical protein